MECLAIGHSGRGRTWRRWVVFGLGIGLAALTLIPAFCPTPSDVLQQQAAEALRHGDFVRSDTLAQQLLKSQSTRAAGLLILAESSARQGRPQEALQHVSEVPQQSFELRQAATLMKARLQCDDLHQPAAAEQTLASFLADGADSHAARELLVYLLGLSGRSWESIPHRLVLITDDPVPIHHLSLLALGSSAAENPEILQAMSRAAPDDPLVLCGLARVDLREGRTSEAEQRLDRVLQLRPDLQIAQAWKGELLLQRDDLTALVDWNAALPAGSSIDPHLWSVRGRWAQRLQDRAGAARCYWECLSRDPNHQTACYQLAGVLSELDDQHAAEAYRTRARLLNDLIIQAKTYEVTGSLSICDRAAEICDQLGLAIEADAWRRARPTSRRPRGLTLGQAPDARRGPRVVPARNTALQFPLSHFPEPQFGPAPSSPSTSPSIPPLASAATAIHFEDVAAASGIDFAYRNGSPPDSVGEYIYEFTGGGAGAIDFDRDGWCDLYLTQGSDKPPDVLPSRLSDALFRNLGNGRFLDCSTASRLVEAGFSQGCAVGDIDSDGFPDIFVANTGGNSLFHNNGDGTFTDVSSQVRQGVPQWTVSVAIADVSGDGHPDLYAVNYITGKDIFREPCRMANGAPRICTPHEFPAAADQLLINQGDGTFEDQTAVSGIDVPEGKGLGIVAGDFDESGRLSLFIANDAVPNFFFQNTAPPGGTVRLEERGYLAGVAVDGDGQPQACMGVAAGDPNQDGRLDLFVTNFHNESNTLYQQQPGGFFVDATRPAHLREASFGMLGFGTQFLDADLDGWQDLVVANGHVGNLEHAGIPYEMPCQFFRNTGNGRFAELPATALGAFFQRRVLGRGLARIDWNRDGREDFLVSLLKSPAALVTNRTENAAHHLSVELVGTLSSRDAIGAVVTVQTPSRILKRQRLAGDGYEASNQRQLIFGLGSDDQIQRLEVRWPSGHLERFEPVSVDTEVVLIEGSPRPYPLRAPKL